MKLHCIENCVGWGVHVCIQMLPCCRGYVWLQADLEACSDKKALQGDMGVEKAQGGDPGLNKYTALGITLDVVSMFASKLSLLQGLRLEGVSVACSPLGRGVQVGTRYKAGLRCEDAAPVPPCRHPYLAAAGVKK